MYRFVPHVPRREFCVRLLSGIALAVTIAITTLSAQIPGRNVNMVAGNTWPDGDPFLQRQNEPSIAASTRNPLHLLGGANDYRTVDLPGLAADETGDAWLGVFKSYDGGSRWTSTLLPGYPQDRSAEGIASPIHGYGAGADPVLRAGSNGLIYYAGLAFDRSNPATPDVPGRSAIFVARYIDNNNKEAGDTFAYLGTRAIQTEPGGTGGNFLDKPWMAVDIPRGTARCTIVTPGDDGPITQNIPAGPVYVAYVLRSTDNQGPRYDVMFSRSTDCGSTWSAPIQLNSNGERTNQGAAMAIDPRNGSVYVSWRQFDLSGGDNDAIMIVKYVPATNQINPLGFAHKFAKPNNGRGRGLNPEHFFTRGGVNRAVEAAGLTPLDQATSVGLVRFRTNAYPSAVVDETGRLYLVWAERGHDPLNSDPEVGSARVLITTSLDGRTFTTARAIANENQRGHQLMPSLTYAGGRLMLIYYDIRETRSQSYTQYIDDRSSFNRTTPEATGLRHTIDLRASMGTPGADPQFAPSVRVSDYLEGPRTPGGPNVPWQVNPPNLPMFAMGTAPFIGDYIDVTAAPNMVLNSTGQWIYNTAASSTPPVFHAAWTDNRDVRVPLEDRNGDGNPWNDYTPPGTDGTTPSLVDPTRTVPMCIPGNAGSRNQNIYTARITGGLIAGSPGNTKKLGYRLDESGNPTTELMERRFVVFVQNTGEDQKRFRLTIANQPAGGRASFDQFSVAPLTAIDAEVGRRSTVSRTVYATSTDPRASITINVAELELNAAGQWVVRTGGLGTSFLLNPDIDNPDIDNPDIDNPDIDNPDIDNAEIFNPDIDNPDIDNPDIDNPDIDNPDIDNPDIDNIEVANPDIDNPDIDNSSLMSDVTWTLTNTGNTTAAYNINLFFAQQTYDPRILTQLILYRTYKTPVVRNCVLLSETRNVLVANVPNPHLVQPGDTVSDPNDPEINNATIYLAPGESSRITLRVFDPSPDPSQIVTVVNADGTTARIVSAFVPNEDVTPVVQQQAVDTESVVEGGTEPPIVVQFPPPQTVPDTASTAENTPVKLNVLANDSTAFGSTKVISFHPDGMASHSGSGPGDIAFQPSTGFLYTVRGAVDPASNALVGRFAVPPPGTFGLASQTANVRTGINYGRTSALNAGVVALDARPDSPTFHQYLPMTPISDFTIGMALDAVHNRLYVVHSPQTSTAATPTTLSVIDVSPSSESFHSVIAQVALPVGVRAQSLAVNSRTQRVYVAATGFTGGGTGGVYLFDVNNAAIGAVRIPNVNGAWQIAVNESSNLVFATTSVGNPAVAVINVIDGVSNAATAIPTAYFMRFGANDERLVVHEASGKVFLRLETQVVIFDGQRGSPTRNTVLAAVNVGREFGTTDIAVDQELGLVVTVGNIAFRADVIDVASNALVASIPVNLGPTDVAIDPRNHRAFVAVGLGYVQEIDLTTRLAGDAIAVFVESGSVLINPTTHKAYVGLFSTRTHLLQLSGAGLEGPVADPEESLPAAGRLLFSAWHNATNTGFIVNQVSEEGTDSNDGSVVFIDGATNSIIGLSGTAGNPFGIGIDQDTNRVFIAHLSSPFAHGSILHANLFDSEPSWANGPNGLPLPDGFTLNTPGSLLGFGRHVRVNPTTHKVYTLQLGGSPVSLAVLDPVTNRLTPLDGQSGTPVFTHLNPGACGGVEQPPCVSIGRAFVIRVDASLNRVFVGFGDLTTNSYRIVVLNGANDQVIGTITAGGHSNRHTASYIAVNEAADEFYVTNYLTSTIQKYSSATLAPIGSPLPLPLGPSAMAYNATAQRIYVSSIDAKTLTAIDPATMTILSTVRLPLVAYFLFVDEVESRIYTSGGDSADESGAMIVTDILGVLGTNVSVTSVGSAQGGTAVLNADQSVTYTPALGFSGPDQFTYTIAAPTGTAIGTVHVNVIPSAPTAVAFGDGYNVLSGSTLNVAAPGPLGNDATGGSATTMAIDNEPDHGIFTPQPDGSFAYTPNEGFAGVDSFTYHAQTDSLGSSNTVTVTISVANPTLLVVTNTSDAGAGSLRQALSTAQVEPNSIISFNIPGTGPHTISPATALPTVTQPTIIDGYTQPGSSPNTAAVGTNAVINIQVRGQSTPSGTSGFLIQGGGSTIRGLAIGNFPNAGIFMELVGGNTIEGNFIGTDAAGLVAAPNGTPPIPPNTGPSGAGIFSRSPNNTIGGMSLAARNLISGNLSTGITVDRNTTVAQSNGTGTVIVNNLVGTNASGNVSLANGQASPVSGQGIQVRVPNVTIGGTTALARNVVSGNNGSGINSFVVTTGSNPQIVLSQPTNLTIQGNYIGVRADGTAALPNQSNGVFLSGANSLVGGSTGTTPGGACTGACNVISGNGTTGLNLGSQMDQSGVVPVVTSSAAGTIVEGNFIGVGPSGTVRIANGSNGMAVNVANVRIGGTTAAQRNLVSGNNSTGIGLGTNTFSNGTVATSGAGSIISGNHIGVDTTGMIAIGNTSSGLAISVPNVRVGGPAAGERNVIGSNGSVGVSSFANTTGTSPNVTVVNVPSGLIVQGNYIGVAVDGLTARPNNGGAQINGANSIVGGVNPGEGNVISGNTGTGLSIGASYENSNATNNGQIYTAGSGSLVLGNRIGTNAAGTAAVPNTGIGLHVLVANVIVGGSTASARNVISGNGSNGLSVSPHFVNATNAVVTTGTGALVRGNYIGLNANGDGIIPNISSGVTVSVPGVTIGGPNAGDRNVIGGNNSTGISSFAARPFNSPVVHSTPGGLIVENNYVGVNPAGTAAMSNVGGGMIIAGANSIIRNNLISGNTGPNFPAGLNVSANYENSLAGSIGTIYSSPDGTQVVGNIIGLNAAGTAAIPNETGMFLFGGAVTVGGNTAALRNVISGNNRNAVSAGNHFISATNTLVSSAAGSVIKGNYIGLNAAGTAAILNLQGGIGVSAANVTIGGATAADGNVLASSLGFWSLYLERQTNGPAVINPGGSNLVQNNIFGLAADGVTRLNSRGASITISSSGNQVVGNTIAGIGTGAAPQATSISLNTASNGTVIRGNYIGTNAAGAQGLHNFGAAIVASNVNNTIVDNNTLLGGNDLAVLFNASAGNTANNNVFTGNRFGLMPDGQTAQNPAVPTHSGLLIQSNGGTISGTVIGGTTVAERNLFGGNGNNAIWLASSGVSNTTIRGNYFGVAADGTTPRGNGMAGVFISGSSDNLVDGNLIAYSAQQGVGINSGGLRNRIVNNRIFSNGGLGIDLFDTANNSLAAPSVSNAFNPGAATQVTVNLAALPAANSYTLQFFTNVACDASGFGEGERLVGTRVIASPGATVSLDELVEQGQFITATATDVNGNTSEFSNCTQVINP